MKKITLVCIGALLLALGGCAPRVKVAEWRIPFLDCLTGEIASYGELFNWGAQQAASEINKAGGIAGKPVMVVPVDTGTDPQKGAVEMARVAQDALVALGPVPEPVILASMPIAVENGMMSFTATTSLEYAEKFFPWSISWFAPTEILSVVTSAWSKQFTDVTKVIQFVEPYGPWPGMAAAHQAGLKSAGLMVLPDVEVPSTAVSFEPLVVKALSQTPDAVIFACNAQKIPKIIKEMKARGWTKMDHMLVFSSGDSPELYTIGGSDINGIEIYNYINPNIDTPRWNAFKQAYMKDHGGELPPSLSTNYYDSVYMIKEAIEKTGVTGDPTRLKEERRKIADYCADVKGFKGIMFSWDMTKDIPTNKPVFIFKIENGQKILVKEVRP
jgi:branched-chain amino acid transport system substrate-binding protein